MPQVIIFQQRIQLRLGEDHNLQKLVLFRLQITEQTQRFQALSRHGLRFVNTEDSLLATFPQNHQLLGDPFNQVMHGDPLRDHDVQLFCKGLIKFKWRQQGVRKIGSLKITGQSSKQFPAQQGLAGPDFTSNLDQALAALQSDQKNVQGLLMSGVVVKIIGIR